MQHTQTFKSKMLDQSIRRILLSLIVLSPIYSFAETTTLPEISAHAKTQDNKKSYTIKKSNSATKMDLSLKDTPQSVTVITQQQISDENLRDTYDILTQTPGVQAVRYGAKGAIGNGGEYAQYYARGQQIINYQIDGVMTAPPVNFKSGSSLSGLDSSIFENVTVIKGATGLTNGAGLPSASINFNRKHANSTEPTGYAKVSYGSWNNVRSEFDAQTALTQDGTTRGRVVAAYEQGDSWKTWGNYRNATLYGVIDHDFSDKSHLSVGAMLSRNLSDGLSVHGLDMYGYDYSLNPYSPSFNAAPRWAYSQVDSVNAFASFNQTFDNDWALHINYNFLQQHIDAIFGVIGTSPKYNSDYANFVSNKTDLNPIENSFDVSVNGKYKLFGQEHDLMFGSSYQYIQNNGDTYKATYTTTSVKPSTWNGYVTAPTFTKNGEQRLSYQQAGYYLATRINATDKLHLILGTRLSDYIAKSYTTSARSSKVSNYHRVTPYAGITYDITNNLTAYASYTNIFLPQSYRNYDYKLLNPQQGNNYEAGFKASFYDNKLNASIAYFESKMDNVALTAGKYTSSDSAVSQGLVTAGSYYYQGANGVKTKGFEAELSGEITPRWSIQTGYSHALSKQAGVRVTTELPVNQFKLSTTYNLPGIFDAVTVGATTRWQSKFYYTGNNSLQTAAYTQKGFALLDLMAKYKITPDLSLGLNIGNVTNVKYRLNYWANTYGDPTSYTGSLTYKF